MTALKTVIHTAEPAAKAPTPQQLMREASDAITDIIYGRTTESALTEMPAGSIEGSVMSQVKQIFSDNGNKPMLAAEIANALVDRGYDPQHQKGDNARFADRQHGDVTRRIRTMIQADIRKHRWDSTFAQIEIDGKRPFVLNNGDWDDEIIYGTSSIREDGLTEMPAGDVANSGLNIVKQILIDNGNKPMSAPELTLQALERGWDANVTRNGTSMKASELLKSTGWQPGQKLPNEITKRLRGHINYSIQIHGDKGTFANIKGADGKPKFVLNNGDYDDEVAAALPNHDEIMKAVVRRVDAVKDFVSKSYKAAVDFVVVREGNFWVVGDAGPADTGVEATGATGDEIDAMMAAVAS